MKRNKKSFTLIEVLIVIVIIGILAAALIPRLQSMQGKARDAKRKVDLKTIADANQIFLLDNGQYATSSGCAININTPGCTSHSLHTAPWIMTLSGYLSSMPIDPLNQTDPNNATVLPSATGNYIYMYFRVFNAPIHTFTLAAQLESYTDPQRNAAIVSGYKTISASGGGTFNWIHQQGYVIAPGMGNPNY